MRTEGRKGGETGGAGEGGAGGTGGAAGDTGGIGTGANVDPSGTGAGGTGATGGNPPANDGGKPETFDKEYVAKLRAESAKHRTELAASTKRLKELEDAQLSDTEKKDKRLAELEQRNRELEAQTRNSGILAQAAAAGATVPQAIVGLVPADAEDIPAAVAALKKQFPDLFRKATPSGTADAGGGTGDDSKPKAGMNEFLRRSAGRF